MKQPDLPRLYSFRRCPYAMRARMAVLLSGQKVWLRELILRDKPAEMLAASPKGTVPVLVLSDGQVIDESLEVMDWAIGAGGGLQPATPEERHLITQNDGAFKHALDRYKYPTRYDDVDPMEHRSAGASILAELNGHLAKQGQLGGKVAGYSDYAIFPFVRQFRIADASWFDAQDWPALHTWLQEHMASPLFTAAMKKYPLWTETQDEFLFEWTEA